MMSAKVFTGAVCQRYVTCVSRLVLPSHSIFAGSKRTPSGCSSGAVGSPLNGAPITVPSNGPLPTSWFTMVRLPAPGWFCTISVGLPGMCLPQWRCNTRAVTS